MPTISLNVYPDRSRPCKLTVAEDGTPLQFVSGGVSRMVVEFEESVIVADSTVDPTLITWNDNGEVFFDFGELGLPIGEYVGTLIVYDPAHPNGQPVVSPEDGNILNFVVVGETNIQIIVEDGSNVTNANSYASIADVRAYALQRGVKLPIDNDTVAAWIIQGMDYIESKSCSFQGEQTYDDPAQSLSWPRTGVILNCKEFDGESIPKQLKAALSQLVIAVKNGVNLFPNFSLLEYIGAVTEETVGPITTKYADPGKVASGSIKPQMTAVDAELSQLFAKCGQGFGLTVYRA